VGKDERDHDEQPEGEATVLSEREAMSLISPDHGEEGVTSEDRSEHFESHDSASSQT
jgi:hypothetical protein